MSNIISKMHMRLNFKYSLFYLLIYIVGLLFYLVTLEPYINELIIKKIPHNLVSNLENMNHLITVFSFLMLFLGFFIESFILFIIANLIGARLNFKNFFKLFIFSNLPVAIENIVISIKNIIVTEPNPYLFLNTSNKLFESFDPFNLLYLIFMFFCLKYESNVNKVWKIALFIVFAFLFRIFF